MSRSSSRRWAGPAIAGSLALVASALPFVATPALAASPDLVISQVYGGGGNTGATYTHDYVQLFNRGTAPVSTTGLSVQYASATGTGAFTATPLGDTSIPAGGSFLVQLRSNGAVGAALPTPDATGVTDLSGTNGKVVLATGTTSLGCNGGSIPCDPAATARIVDLIGYGTANFFEGTAAAPALSNTSAAVRAGGGCTDTDQNSADFTAAAPAPRNSSTTPAPCGTTPGPATPVPSCPSTLTAEAGVGASAPVSATDADSRIATVTLSSPPAGITLTGLSPSAAVGAPGSATLTVAPSTAVGSYAVEVVFGTDGAPAQTVRCTVDVTVADSSRVSPVHEVQGSGAASPLVGQRVNVEAVVTSLITSRDVVDGFYVQEQVADADPSTSEGVYVFCRSLCPAGLAGGDLVRVTGTVAEFNGTTQVDASTQGTTITVLESDQPLPPAAVTVLPAQGSTRDAATFERFEGMRTTISTTLAVAEYFNQAQFGELVLEAGSRSYQYTQVNDPSVEGYAAFLAELATRRIVLDDASNDQNDATSGPLDDEPYFYPTPGLSTGNAFRGGDTITGLTGVMEYAFGSWRLRPVEGQAYEFTAANPRPDEPEDVGGRLQVASFNVLNYFADVDTTSSNSSGPCGPSGTDDCRGADSEIERQRQLAKIVAALVAIDADVFGLIEIQNDEGAATEQLVDELNAALEAKAPGTGTYDFIRTGTIGTDAIKQAFVYDTTTVAPVGPHRLLASVPAGDETIVDARFDTTRNRPSLIQTFEEVETGERLTVSVNHFKSKGSGCGAGDDSTADGSGNCDLTRTRAAQALVDLLAKDPTGSGDPDFLIIGDLNSYAQERPIAAIEGAGYVNLLQQFEGSDSYGYLFDGLLGDLDHALASPSLLPQVTGAGGWDINADENPLFDYNDTERTTGEAAFERESSALPLYEANAYRSSDHDPAIVGLDLSSPNRAPVADAGGPYTVRVGRLVTLDARGSSDPNRLDELSYAWDLDGDGAFDDATGATVALRGTGGPRTRTVAVRVSDGDLTSVDTATVRVTLP